MVGIVLHHERAEMIMRAVLVLIGLIGLTGCPGTVSHMNRLPESEALTEPASINRPGPVVHEASGLEFAERYGGFERVSAFRFDEKGLDVGMGYNERTTECLVVSTFYVYPTPRMSFMGAAPEVEHYHKLESPEVARVTTQADGETLGGAALTFREGDTLGELRLFVYRHQWFLKYRFTWPQPCDSGAHARLEALVGSMPWAVAQ
jgi:hypothetical protein